MGELFYWSNRLSRWVDYCIGSSSCYKIVNQVLSNAAATAKNTLVQDYHEVFSISSVSQHNSLTNYSWF